jgi:two-component system response regulator DesR
VFESSAKAIESKLRALKPDVALLDIDMPGIDAFALAESMAAAAPEIRAVMFSGHLNRAYIERALDCGAWGYLSKNDDVDSIIAGVRKVADGQIALSAEVEMVLRRDHVG